MGRVQAEGGGGTGPYLLWASVSSCPHPAAPEELPALTGDCSEFAFILETSVPRAWGDEGGQCGQLSGMQERGESESPVLPGA